MKITAQTPKVATLWQERKAAHRVAVARMSEPVDHLSDDEFRTWWREVQQQIGEARRALSALDRPFDLARNIDRRNWFIA